MALVLQHSFSPSAVPLPRNRRSKSLFSSISCKISNSASSFSSLSFSSNLSLFHHNVSEGVWPMRAIEKSSRRHSIVCEAAPSKKADSAAKRARQSEKRRLINKSRKSEVRTRMKKFKLEECKIKFGSGGGRSHSLVPLHYPDYRNDFLGMVLVALDVLRRKKGAEVEEVLPVEKLIGEAYSAIDKAVRRGIMHRNTGKHRKSRLARRKRSVLIHHGWYTPATASA